MSEDNLTKIHLDLPRNIEIGGESFWAEDLGNDLYRMRNTPFHAYGLNFYDIVYAKAESKEWFAPSSSETVLSESCCFT